MSHTLLHIENVVWIIAEDSETCSDFVNNFVRSTNLPYVHLTSPMPKMYLDEEHKPRGVSNRRASMKWILENHEWPQEGVLYFADDDNTYDLKLFEQIRKTKKVSMFPVGFIGKTGVSSPIVKGGKVIGFHDAWFGNREFPIDMAGFAVNVRFLRDRINASMPFLAGAEENMFLQSLQLRLIDIGKHIGHWYPIFKCLNLYVLEPLANGCTEVLVWHTKSKTEDLPQIKPSNLLQFHNLKGLFKDLIYKGVVLLNSESPLEIGVCLNGAECDTV